MGQPKRRNYEDQIFKVVQLSRREETEKRKCKESSLQFTRQVGINHLSRKGKQSLQGWLEAGIVKF